MMVWTIPGHDLFLNVLFGQVLQDFTPPAPVAPDGIDCALSQCLVICLLSAGHWRARALWRSRAKRPTYRRDLRL